MDNYFASYWVRHKLTPAPLVDDATFLRRASLAVLGVPAKAGEVRAFLADRHQGKRQRKVDDLLVRSRYADYWGFRLRDWITQLREVSGQGTGTLTLYRYARTAMAENRSWKRHRLGPRRQPGRAGLRRQRELRRRFLW